MSRSAAVEDQEGDTDRRARGQAAGGGGVDGRPPKPPPPMRSMSREDSCASNSAAASDSRNANGARILLAQDIWWLFFLRYLLETSKTASSLMKYCIECGLKFDNFFPRRLTRLLENSQSLFAPPPPVYDCTDCTEDDQEVETGIAPPPHSPFQT